MSSPAFQHTDTSSCFKLKSNYKPTGDQPSAIEKLCNFIKNKGQRSVLLGVTGSGKTFTIANVVAQLNRPALVLAHNKTLAAQLFSEFSELFPENAVRYFVSYYDYYQPEAYVPATDTYIEKDASVNDEIDKLRHAATKSLLERRDSIIVASVSCIYGLGDPQTYFDMMLYLETSEIIQRSNVLKKLVLLQYERNDIEFDTGTFRVRGDVIEICPASESENAIRLSFFGSKLEEISEIDRLSGKVKRHLDKVCVYPASHFVTSRETLDKAVETIRAELESHLLKLNREGKVLEAHRLEQRTLYDLELMSEMGFCPGIENYSRHLTARKEGEPPPTLIDYFPQDFLVFIDESHVTVPQLVGMSRGDRARKQNLVDFGFRLPSALDNRPLTFDEFQARSPQIVYVSATPSNFELKDSNNVIVEQIIRPTGLLDPSVEVRSAKTQVDDFLAEVNRVADVGERALVTTLTKKMAEDLSEYYQKSGVRAKYLHSDIHTLDRIELIRGLRNGEFDLLIGINLLREGLDLPEVSLVGVMDADKEGFLRSETSIIQTIGRAARNVNGLVLLYADKVTQSMERAIKETERRRLIQDQYNKANGIIPKTVVRAPEAVMVELDLVEDFKELCSELNMPIDQLPKDISSCKDLERKLKQQMYDFARLYEFEKAAVVRDNISVLEKYILSLDN